MNFVDEDTWHCQNLCEVNWENPVVQGDSDSQRLESSGHLLTYLAFGLFWPVTLNFQLVYLHTGS